MSEDEDKKIAFVLYDIFKTKDKKEVNKEIYNSLHYTIREQLDISKEAVLKQEEELSKIDSSDIPYQRRISLLKVDKSVKTKAFDKLKSIKNSFQGDNKAQSWLDGLLKIPFGVFRKKFYHDIQTRFY